MCSKKRGKSKMS